MRVPMVEQPKRSKRKKLLISDFHGKADESVEAWLASVLKEAGSQARLGGDEWTVDELYHGAVQHLKGEAVKWFITWSQHVPPGDETFAYLVKKMRGKCGRRGNAFQIQQRLGRRQQQPGERLSDFADSLVDIGYGQNVPDDTYREAFLTGINNEVMATQIPTMKPETMEDAVQMAIGTCGEYGEGLSVTDWKMAQQRYRTDRGSIGEDAGLWKKAAKPEMASQFGWKQLGLGFGSEAQLMYDTSGEAASGLAETAKKDPLSLATLRALMVMVGVGDKAVEANEPCVKPAAGKIKTRALEVIAERTAEDARRKEEPAPRRHEWLPQAAGVGGRDYGGRWNKGGRGRDGGRGAGLENYGPVDNRPIARRKAESACSYCGCVGHWWRECAARLEASNTTEAQQSKLGGRGAARVNEEEKTAPAANQGNAQQQ
ncbi:unnamed protein product [Phytophthora fragariaefolia]|uniref:Unnamed protein product n=1 Tax=Phytophthora fragariaefolia TaxID=1490495 RepID=A0A9W6U5S4_9STRA|nr:unnamed protein product [Phytophthora fragariaefolia]